MKSLKLFWLFKQNAYKIITQGRLGVIFFAVGKIIRFIMMFLFIMFIYSRIKILKGYTFQQVALFYLVYNLIDTLSQLLFREVYRFRSLVTSGGFDGVLLKPYHPFLRILIGGIDILDVLLLIPYVILFLFFAFQIRATISHIIISFLLFLNGMWIATSFHIIVLALGILTTEVDHTIMIYRDISSLGRFPMTIYKEPIRSFFTFIIPIGIMMSFPAQALFSLFQPVHIVLAFSVSFCLCIAAMSLWKHALTQYQSWGG